MSPKTITVIGSLNTDLVTLTPRVPTGGETLTATSFSTGPGGKGANQAVACARLSRPNPASAPSHTSDVLVRMIGAVGDDEFGPSLISSLKDSLIDTKSIQTIPEQSTGVAVILVESDSGENRILLSPGANHSLKPTAFSSPSSLGTPLPSLLVLQLEIPIETVLQILSTAQASNVPVLLNPAPAVKLPNDAYPSITHLILNETEAAILTDRDIQSVEAPDFDWRSITKDFLSLGVKTVIITLGAKGAIFATGDVYEHVPAEKDVKVVDTTAAGDTFVGAYAVELVRNANADARAMVAAVAKACKAAARTVEKEGAQSAIPWADEVEGQR
ncbi:hypothetical protein MFRU_001g03960 [Monilinia fructicola]|uniref:Ribokinase n=1 Tax=Monilinia fructicola TaxID=38448 RepID=A0A5M9JYA8_MONFR|nr:hypothetical protein EYC84_005220 [Monilinia fructicola]KAG4035627.1 hypothetical protein MFRU_001g03960 [Monilinia fructicola]